MILKFITEKLSFKNKKSLLQLHLYLSLSLPLPLPLSPSLCLSLSSLSLSLSRVLTWGETTISHRILTGPPGLGLSK